MIVQCQCGLSKKISIDYYKRLLRNNKLYQCLKCACAKSWTDERKKVKSDQMTKLWEKEEYKREVQWKKRLGLIFR